MWCNAHMPKVFKSKWFASSTTHKNIEERSMDINTLRCSFHHLPCILTQYCLPPPHLYGLQYGVLWAHPLVYLQQMINTI